MVPHTLTINKKIQNFNITPKNMTTIFWERKRPLLIKFSLKDTQPTLLLTVRS